MGDLPIEERVSIETTGEIRFEYVNWRREKRIRAARVERFYFGSTEYHTEDQWLMEGFDFDKKANRIYACSDITGFVVPD
tara:strand:+ start:342 stop:581 length:240 start_codon:yes stop_codon:yes gene_type:complete